MSVLTARTTSTLSAACVALGGASIIASIATWASARGETSEERAHAERFGIFVGLWAPTFLILGDYLRRSASTSARSEPGRIDAGSRVGIVPSGSSVMIDDLHVRGVALPPMVRRPLTAYAVSSQTAAPTIAAREPNRAARCWATPSVRSPACLIMGVPRM